MRLFLLLALAFALISVSLVVSQNPGFLRQTQQLMAGSNDAAPAAPAASLTDSPATLWSDLFEHTSFVGMQDNGWQALSGFPSFAKIIIPLPRKVTLTEGRLRLSLSTQLAESGVGTLRVSINNTRRADLVLKTGEDRRSLLLGLTPEDLGRPRIVVSLTVQGDAFSGVCPSRPARGVVVDVLPESGVELAHSEALSDPLDIWLADTKPARFYIHAGDDAAQRADSLLLAARLKQLQHNVEFFPQADAENAPIQILSVDRSQSESLIYDDQTGGVTINDPNLAVTSFASDTTLSLADLLPGSLSAIPADENTILDDDSTRTFFRSHRWRMNYDLTERRAGRAPSQLRLALKTSNQLEGADWLVRVLLNNNLLASYQLETGSDVFERTVSLPAELQLPDNEIAVDLLTTDITNSICDPGLEVAAQILPETKLSGEAATNAQIPIHAVKVLGEPDRISMTAQPQLSSAQAAIASSLIAYVLPQDTLVETSAQELDALPTRLDVIDRAGLQERLGAVDLNDTKKQYWVVSETDGESAAQAPYQVIPVVAGDLATSRFPIYESAVFLFIETSEGAISDAQAD